MRQRSGDGAADDGLREGTDSRLRFSVGTAGTYTLRARTLSGVEGISSAFTLAPPTAPAKAPSDGIRTSIARPSIHEVWSTYVRTLIAAIIEQGSVRLLVEEHRITHVMNAVDPRFVMPIFDGALAAGADYLDMAMSLSKPHPERPYEEAGVKLGDEQFAKAGEWEAAGRLATILRDERADVALVPLLVDGAGDTASQGQQLRTGRAAVIDEHERLFFVTTRISHAFSFPSALFNQPSGRNFYPISIRVTLNIFKFLF